MTREFYFDCNSSPRIRALFGRQGLTDLRVEAVTSAAGFAYRGSEWFESKLGLMIAGIFVAGRVHA